MTAATVQGVSPDQHPGTARRLQALAYTGWSATELGRRLGVTRWTVEQARAGKLDPAPLRVAFAVEALYDELWDVPGGSPGATDMARPCGWCPPMAWDDDRPGDLFYTGHGIDDPAGCPAPEWRRQPRRPAEDLFAELHDLMGMGMSANQAAVRLRMSGATRTRVWQLFGSKPGVQDAEPAAVAS